jgi:uncharacterized protein YgiM (DUF1202 family)
MKTTTVVILGAVLSTSLLAQQPTNPPAAAPVATNLPAAKAEKQKSPAPKKKAAPETARKATPEKKAVAVEKPVTLVAGPAVIAGSNVNVRGQASLTGEVITRLTKGDTVTVLEQINLEKPKADEPAQWAKIAFPTGGHVWVNTAYIDRTNKTVLPRRLNLRAGPGENYSVVGLLERGAPVKEITTKGNWTEIEPPPTAYAFVAAEYLKQEALVAAAPAPAVVQPAPTPTPVAQVPEIAMPPTNAPIAPPTSAPTVTPPSAPAVAPPVVETPPVTPAAEEPPPKRIVDHEGVVRTTWSIQAPTKYALVNPDTGATVDYLYTTSTNLDLSRWKGHRVIVTGEESLDERWGNTPVITIQRIHVVD